MKMKKKEVVNVVICRTCGGERDFNKRHESWVLVDDQWPFCSKCFFEAMREFQIP
jgi:hypothetical protein